MRNHIENNRREIEKRMERGQSAEKAKENVMKNFMFTNMVFKFNSSASRPSLLRARVLPLSLVGAVVLLCFVQLRCIVLKMHT